MKTKTFKLVIVLVCCVGFSACTKDVELVDPVELENEHELQSRAISEASPFYYTGQGQKEYFTIRKDQVLIKTASNVEAKEVVSKNSSLFNRKTHSMGTWAEVSIDAKATRLDDVLKLQGVVDASYGLEWDMRPKSRRYS